MKIFYDPEGEAPAGGTPPAAGESTPGGGETPPAEGAAPSGGEAPPAEVSDFSKWRDGLGDETLKKQANQYNSGEDMVRSIIKMRNNGADKTFRVPGEDADAAEMAQFHQAMGIPENAQGYEFPAIAEGVDKAVAELSRTLWGEAFQKANVSVEGAKLLTETFQKEAAQIIQAENDADADFATETKAILEQEWGKDYENNQTFANKAVEQLFGSTLEDVRHIQTKDNKFVLDHPAFVRVFAAVGREMSEGGMGEVVTPEQRQTARESIKMARDKRVAAQKAGNNEEAKFWDQKERDAWAAMEKPQPLVGTEGRTV